MTTTPERATHADPRWRAVMARDAAAAGFVFAVRTTGVYCRPACPARRPKVENVEFFADPAAAKTAGYRACRRCRPDQPAPAVADQVRVVREVCRCIEAAPGPIRLAELAVRAGYSPFHLQRMFKVITGMTPRAYAEACRAKRLAGELANGRGVTAAMHRAGISSTSRLHAVARLALGMTPRRARAGGEGEHIDYAVVACSLGRALIAMTKRGVCAILLGDDDEALRADLQRRLPQAQLRAGGPAFVQRLGSVVACIDGSRPDPGLPLDVRGTVFQARVWAALRAIPAGRTANYSEIARQLGSPRGARAVAKACAHNPLAVIVPCHRVVRSDGDLSGYRWGLARKRALLARERVQPQSEQRPSPPHARPGSSPKSRPRRTAAGNAAEETGGVGADVHHGQHE